MFDWYTRLMLSMKRIHDRILTPSWSIEGPLACDTLFPLSIPWIPKQNSLKGKNYQDNGHVIPTKSKRISWWHLCKINFDRPLQDPYRLLQNPYRSLQDLWRSSQFFARSLQFFARSLQISVIRIFAISSMIFAYLCQNLEDLCKILAGPLIYLCINL